MIYHSGHILIYVDDFRISDNHKYRPRPYSKRAQQVEQELQEFCERWLDDIRRINETFEAGEDDSLFPTEQYCEPVNEPIKKRGFDPSQPLWGIDYLLRKKVMEGEQ